MRVTMNRQAYSSDLTDKQWELLDPLIPQPSLEGRPPIYERREIVNAILYVLRSGCPWRLLPHDLPTWGHHLLVLSTLARRRRLGSGLTRPTHGGAQKARPPS